VNATSGDHNPSDPDLETFNPLFPDASYFTDANLIGQRNHFDIHPVQDVHPVEDLEVGAS
jgi:hypothetical protein